MTIYPSRPPEFTCAICCKAIKTDSYPSSRHPIPPLCRSCESGGEYARGYSYGTRYSLETNPDKRILSQVRALVDEIQFEAINHGRT